MFVDEQYTYCEVLPANYQTSWSYICDFEISPGKFVVVPIRSENREKVALVLSVRRCSEGDAPYPPHSTKHILRVFGENEPGELQLQKKALAAEYTKRFPSAEQARCLSIRENKLAIKNKLFKNNVRFLYKGIIIKHNKTEPTYTKTSLFLCEKRRFFMARTEKGVVATI